MKVSPLEGYIAMGDSHVLEQRFSVVNKHIHISINFQSKQRHRPLDSAVPFEHCFINFSIPGTNYPIPTTWRGWNVCWRTVLVHAWLAGSQAETNGGRAWLSKAVQPTAARKQRAEGTGDKREFIFSRYHPVAHPNQVPFLRTYPWMNPLVNIAPLQSNCLPHTWEFWGTF